MVVGYLESEKGTMSEELLPRAKASCLPLGDQAKHQIWPEVKGVNCFGGPQESGNRPPGRATARSTTCRCSLLSFRTQRPWASSSELGLRRRGSGCHGSTLIWMFLN